MKKIISLLCSAAIVALSLAGCSKNETPEQGDQAVGVERVVTFSANTPSTKSYFGDKTSNGYPTVWTANTKVGISVNYNTPKDAVVTPIGSGNKATFDASMTQPSGASEYVFYAVSPSSVAVSANSTYSSFLLDIPSSQSPTKGSVDEAAHIMFAQSATLTTWPAEGTTVNLDFSHLAAYGKFTLENFREDGTSGKVKVNSVNIESDSVIAGRFYYYPAANHFSPNPASNVVTINTENIEYTHNNSDLTIWFAIRPVDLKGSNMKITLNTTDGTFEKTFKFPVDKGTFKSGKVGSFVIDMDGIGPKQDEVYTLVTDYNVLKEDAKVIIAAAESDYAISTTQQNNNRAGAGVTKTTENNVSVIKNPASDVQIFVLEQGTVDNTVAFKCDGGTQDKKYIGSPAENQNWMRSFDAIDDNCSFNVTLKQDNLSDGVLNYAILKSNTTVDNKFMRFNAGSSNIFSLYKENSSVTGKVALYVLNNSGSGSSIVDPVTDSPVITFDETTHTVTITCPDATARIGYSIDGSEPGIDTHGDPLPGTLEYTAPFVITQTTTVKAFAGADHKRISPVVSKVCTVSSSTTVTANYVFNTDAGLTALGIAKPAASAGTNLASTAYTVNGVSMVSVTASGKTATRVWNSSGNTDLRIYSGSTLTFSVDAGKNIKSIELTGATINGFTVNTGTYTTSTGAWSGSAQSVVFTATATEKINTITVKYE